MVTDNNAIAALIGSRICHDLISPIGAVTNGIELLELSGIQRSPELTLVAESVASANARIRFFRLAFGVASKDQQTGADEVNKILRDLYTDDRTQVGGLPAGSFPRAQVRAVLLALMCAEQAVPFGGSIKIEHDGRDWLIRATSSRLNTDAPLWSRLNGADVHEMPAPSCVQFLILPAAAAEAKMTCTARLFEKSAEVRLSPA